MIPARTFEENPSEGIVILPGGLFENGTCLREVKLRPPTGRGEELLGDASNSHILAGAITTLLVHCIERIGSITDITPEIVQNLLVGDRDYLVLKLREMTNGNRVEATLVCPNPQCREKIDINFDLEHIHVKPGKITAQVFTQKLPRQIISEKSDKNGECRVDFRLPNGGDQEDLALLVERDETEAVNKLLARCIQHIDGIAEIDESHIAKLSIAAREKIESTMADLTPQIDLELEAQCPECEEMFLFPFNIAQFFLNELKVNLNQLYEEVHFLAFYYKWSEQEILSMTRNKRRRYLALLSEHIEKGYRGYT